MRGFILLCVARVLIDTLELDRYKDNFLCEKIMDGPELFTDFPQDHPGVFPE